MPGGGYSASSAAGGFRIPPVVNPDGWPAGSPNIRLALANQNLLDTSGNGLNATVQGGTERYTYFTPTIGAFLFDGATTLTVAGAQPLLSLPGAMTLIAYPILRTRGVQQFLIGYEDQQETEADNTQYSIFYEADGSVTYISESGAGVNFSVNVNSYAEIGQVSMIGVTRDGAGNVQLYLDRGIWGAPALGALPTGGGNARFRIGGREAGATPFNGSMCGVVLYPFHVTEAQWRIMFNATMGPYAGFVEP